MIPVARPAFSKKERVNLIEAIDSGWISSKGKYIEQFEQAFAKKYGAKYAIASSNGTTALHLGLIAAGVKAGDEVIVPDFTFISSANAVVHCGAKPILADIEKESWCIDPEKIEKLITKRTKAIMAVHIYGRTADMKTIRKIADKHSLAVIEDCAEAQGAKIGGKYIGSFGEVGCFSFFGNKIMTTGEGGMCITDSKKMYETMKLYRAHGMSEQKRYHHPVVGYNYRMTNMQAAVGMGQLESVDEFIKEREHINSVYDKELSSLYNHKIIERMPENEKSKSVCWFYSILVKKNSRDALMDKLAKNGIETRPFFLPISKQECYKYLKSSTGINSSKLSQEGINLPTFVGLKDGEIKKITSAIKEFVE